MSSPESSASARGWENLDPEPRPPFHDLRLQLHWAAQCVGAFGEAMVEAQPDASHTSMTWDEGERGLLGMPARDGIRLGLGLASPCLYLRDPEGWVKARLPLEGQTLDACLSWTSTQLATISTDSPERPLVLAEYAMPEHAVATGAAFGPFDRVLCGQMSAWYGNAALALQEVRAELPGAGEIRCWPHHFDLATLWSMDPEESNADKARSIGCGMLLGDDSVSEPYFYCNPWPRPLTSELPPLDGGGSWHTKGWVGALLRAGELENSAAAQAAQVAAFFRSAIAANRQLLKARN